MTRPDAIDELIQARLEGCATDRELDELQQLEEQRVRAETQAYQRLCDSLDQLQSLEAPPTLSENVMAAIPRSIEAVSAMPPSPAGWFSRDIFRYGLAGTAAVLLLLVLVYQPRSPPDDRHAEGLAGTMAPGQGGISRTTSVLQGPDLQGLVELRSSDEMVQLAIRLERPAAARAKLVFDERAYRLAGREGLPGTASSTPGGAGQVTIELPEAQWTRLQLHVQGVQRPSLTIEFEKDGAAVDTVTLIVPGSDQP